MTVGMLRSVIQCKQKKPEIDNMKTTPCQFDKCTCQVFISIKKYKTVFKIVKDYLKLDSHLRKKLFLFASLNAL